MLIKLILSISFAEESDLGWDQTIKARYKGNTRVFDIEISGKHYRTNSSNIISVYDEDRIFNSGSRIFKAFDVKDRAKKNPLIIKDHWFIDFYNSEDDIQKMILEDIIDPDEREIFKRSTLTVVASSRVQVGGRDDHTRDTILHGLSPTQAYEIFPPNNSEEKKGGVNLLKEYKFWREACALPSTSSLQFAEMKVFGILFHRYHHRVIYKEVAIPFHRLRNLEDMVLVLSHSVEGMYNNHLGFWYLILFFSPSSYT